MQRAFMEEKITPMMQQWHSCKAKAKEALLLFRLGDFYEAFYEDAKTLSEDLDVTLTKRGDIPMSGIPAHTIENHLEVLIGKGRLIAIAEQVEDPKTTKGIVKREIVRLLSKGAVFSSSLLSEKESNFFVSICLLNSRFGLAAVDVSTAKTLTMELSDSEEVLSELHKLSPSELLLSDKASLSLYEKLQALPVFSKPRMTVKPQWHFDHEICLQMLLAHFKVHNLDGFGLKGQTCAINALGALLSHLKDDLHTNIDSIKSSKHLAVENFLSIDPSTARHLDLFSSSSEQCKDSSLLHLLDHTSTPMGARLFKEWLSRPLLDVAAIEERQNTVSFLLHEKKSEALKEGLCRIRDIERILLKIKAQYHVPKDLVVLKNSLKQLPLIIEILKEMEDPLLQKIYLQIEDLSLLTDEIEKTLCEEAAYKNCEGQLIHQGVDASLDELKKIKSHAEDYLLSYQERLKEETGIKTLKVGYSKAFGYFIDISRGQASKVPSYFHKRQTLVNNERFITPELQEFEDKILHAEEKILTLESQIYQKLRETTLCYSDSIKRISTALADCDCLFSLFLAAQKYGYVRPKVDVGPQLKIEEGRHPILEQKDFTGSFIPNDTFMDGDESRLHLITGPNMAGKSTYLRQVALLVLMAQIGSFLPVKSANVGIVDRIFTRIGASDDLSRGQSTFMVEMSETASILRHATEKSLIILDEIGRGTSTYDGISIAWAVADYLLKTTGKEAKTLFATHYCELIELEEKYKGAKNYHAFVHETEEGIVFMRKIKRGGADKSYGIHVGKLAGLPLEVVMKAQEILKNLEMKPLKAGFKKPLNKRQEQLLLFDTPKKSIEEEIAEEIKKIHIEETTPLQALNLLEHLKRRLK